jgi:hypothetical protein
MKISSSFLGWKNKPSKKPELLALLVICFHAGFLLDNGGDMFLQNVG